MIIINRKMQVTDSVTVYPSEKDIAKTLYDAGYRKAEEVEKEMARKILKRFLSWKSTVIFDTESVLIAEKNFEDCIKSLAVEEYGMEALE